MGLVEILDVEMWKSGNLRSLVIYLNFEKNGYQALGSSDLSGTAQVILSAFYICVQMCIATVDRDVP